MKKIGFVYLLPIIFLISACSISASDKVDNDAKTVAESDKSEDIEETKKKTKERKSDDESVEKKEQSVNLFFETPAYSNGAWFEAAATTSVEGEDWTDVIQISPSTLANSGGVSYITEGRYKKLKATVAPEDDWEGGASAKLIVYVDNDVKAYESPAINKDTEAFSIEVDITDKDAFTIRAIETRGSPGHIILKDAVIE